MVRALKQRHLDVVAGYVLNRPIASLAEDESVPHIGAFRVKATATMHGEVRSIFEYMP